jgi:glutamate synthase domain-containing protein 1/glutamate synthase domain-containing protein 3
MVARILASRKQLNPEADPRASARKAETEGGCGVVGIACNEKIPARHLLRGLTQMRNRGNGKGGGIAAVGLEPAELGVSREVLESHYLLAIAYLDASVRSDVERECLEPTFEIVYARSLPASNDSKLLGSLDVRPPEVCLYFGRVRPEAIHAFRANTGLEAAQTPGVDSKSLEDEVVYQNSFRLNRAYYASTGEKRAFVLSHGKNMLALKMVGYGDDVIRCYRLDDLHAHVWLGHHRYPTKGKVWHPGGAHPFVGLHEALVHNGDFANYASICEYLAQRNIYPLFLTDTEVSVLLFDLLHRTYSYPLEYVIESLAPTTERDFTLLPQEKQAIYQQLQTVHMHGSPDGPWFFLIAQSVPAQGVYRLIGITDTSMLRPQVFAMQQGEVSIGLAASEKQAIDATLESLAGEDSRFWSHADLYWNARGGSHTDGGAFIFTVQANGACHSERSEVRYLDPDGVYRTPEIGESPQFGDRATAEILRRPDRIGTPQDDSVAGHPLSQPRPAAADPACKVGATLVCTDKFGRRIELSALQKPYRASAAAWHTVIPLPDLTAGDLFAWAKEQLPAWDYDSLLAFLKALENTAGSDEGRRRALSVLARLLDGRYPTGSMRRSYLLSLLDASLGAIFESIRRTPSTAYAFVSERDVLLSPSAEAPTVVVDARGFAPEGENSLAREIVRLYQRGFRQFIVAHARGHRFIANGLGPASDRVRIDVYGSSGDYLASGIDGAEVFVHGDAQDQLAQIMKDGKLVVYGSVGQTFLYAGKGGQAFVLGNAAGRPLINAVGKPRVVINGTCLDYLAESFMAGDPLAGGGCAVLNGIALNDQGQIVELDMPYPGGNLFSLAAGGAIYIRDPHAKVSEEQLNGGEFALLEEADWALVSPLLEENERLFGIPLSRLLEVDGAALPPAKVYRKIRPKALAALHSEEAWVRMNA